MLDAMARPAFTVAAIALWVVGGAFGSVACGNVQVPHSQADSAWSERVFSDASCSSDENPAAPPLDVMALRDALVRGGERANACLGPEDRGTLLVVLGGRGCVRAILLERPVSARVEQCLVHAFAGTRVPPFREGVVRAGSGWTHQH
jgi:hypothetical protein